MQELKKTIENLDFMKSTLARQLEDTKRKLEEEERVRQSVE